MPTSKTSATAFANMAVLLFELGAHTSLVRLNLGRQNTRVNQPEVLLLRECTRAERLPQQGPSAGVRTSRQNALVPGVESASHPSRRSWNVCSSAPAYDGKAEVLPIRTRAFTIILQIIRRP